MKYLLSILSAGFLVLLMWAFFQKPISESGELFFSDPWGIVALADLYLGFFIFSIFIFKNEDNKICSILWTTALLVLGNLISAIYITKFLFNKRELVIKK